MKPFYESEFLNAKVAEALGHDIAIIRADDGSCTIQYGSLPGEYYRVDYFRDGKWVIAGSGEPWLEYTSDASADYEVLRYVWDNWLFSARLAFKASLTKILRDRAGDSVDWPDLLFYYRPGDYSRALLAVLDNPEEVIQRP